MNEQFSKPISTLEADWRRFLDPCDARVDLLLLRLDSIRFDYRERSLGLSSPFNKAGLFLSVEMVLER